MGSWPVKMADSLLLRSSTALPPSPTSGHSVVHRFGEADDSDWWWQISAKRTELSKQKALGRKFADRSSNG